MQIVGPLDEPSTMATHQRSSKSRTASRSPAPPRTPIAATHGHAQFLPPSHFAAAAGLPYPYTPLQRGAPADLQMTPRVQSTVTSTPKSLEPRNSHQRWYVTSTPQESSSSATSYLDPKHTDRSSPSPALEEQERGKRKSKSFAPELGLGLGLAVTSMETSLLPTLRDTVDRMTRPPSQMLVEPAQYVNTQSRLALPSPRLESGGGLARPSSRSSRVSGFSSTGRGEILSKNGKNDDVPQTNTSITSPTSRGHAKGQIQAEVPQPAPSTPLTAGKSMLKPRSILKSPRFMAGEHQHNVRNPDGLSSFLRADHQSDHATTPSPVSDGPGSHIEYTNPQPHDLTTPASQIHAQSRVYDGGTRINASRTRARTDPGAVLQNPHSPFLSARAGTQQSAGMRSHIPRRVVIASPVPSMSPSPSPSASEAESGGSTMFKSSPIPGKRKSFISNVKPPLGSSTSSGSESEASGLGVISDENCIYRHAHDARGRTSEPAPTVKSLRFRIADAKPRGTKDPETGCSANPQSTDTFSKTGLAKRSQQSMRIESAKHSGNRGWVRTMASTLRIPRGWDDEFSSSERYQDGQGEHGRGEGNFCAEFTPAGKERRGIVNATKMTSTTDTWNGYERDRDEPRTPVVADCRSNRWGLGRFEGEHDLGHWEGNSRLDDEQSEPDSGSEYSVPEDVCDDEDEEAIRFYPAWNSRSRPMQARTRIPMPAIRTRRNQEGQETEHGTVGRCDAYDQHTPKAAARHISTSPPQHPSEARQSHYDTLRTRMQVISSQPKSQMTTPEHAADQDSSTAQRYSSELSRIMALSSAAAAQQRAAFGISEHGVSSSARASVVLSSAGTDSNLSSASLGCGGWRGDDDGDGDDGDGSVETGSILQQWASPCDGRQEHEQHESSNGSGSLRYRVDENERQHRVRMSLCSFDSQASSESTFPTQESPPTLTPRADQAQDQAWPAYPSCQSSIDGFQTKRWGYCSSDSATLPVPTCRTTPSIEDHRFHFLQTLGHSESTFVRRLQDTVQRFVVPLRVRGSRAWVQGVPREATRVFDWLEDVLRIHVRLWERLNDVLGGCPDGNCVRRASRIVKKVTATNSTVTMGCEVDPKPPVVWVSEVLGPFVAALEVYQPYFVKLETVATLLDKFRHSRDAGIDKEDEQDLGGEGIREFCEFIRLQESLETNTTGEWFDKECKGSSDAVEEEEQWSLERSLVEPINRLGYYLDFMRNLMQVTPKSHPDYVPTLSLLGGATHAMRVLSEVKAREDAYVRLKKICGRLRTDEVRGELDRLAGSKGHIVDLASRERSLLMCGPLRCAKVRREGDYDGTSGDEPKEGVLCREQSTLTSPSLHSAQRRSESLSSDESCRGDVPSKSPGWRSRFGSAWSSAGWRTGHDNRSPSSSSSSLRLGLGVCFGTPEAKLPREQPDDAQVMDARSPGNELRDVEVLVFTDLIVLAVSTPSLSPASLSSSSTESSSFISPPMRAGGQDRGWCHSRQHQNGQASQSDSGPLLHVLDKYGLAQIIGVQDDIDSRGYLTLDLLPLTVADLEVGHAQLCASVVSVSLFHSPAGAGTEMGVQSGSQLRDWLAPLRACCQHTLRAISSSPFVGGSELRFVHARKGHVSRRREPLTMPQMETPTSVRAPVGVGLVLPRSPSMQLGEGSLAEEEREERGWWTKRFHDVFEELS